MADTPHRSNPDTERLICFCHCVSYATLVDAIRSGATTLEAIKEQTCASTGCGGCELDVSEILKEELELSSGQ